MTVAKVMKSPGQKLKTPKKGPATPKVKSPKGKDVASPKGTPKASMTPKGPKTPKEPKTPNAPKTPKTPNAPKTPKSPNAPKTPNAGGKQKTPKKPNTPQVANGSVKPQTPKANGSTKPVTPKGKPAPPKGNGVPQAAVKPTPTTVQKSPKKRSASEAGLNKDIKDSTALNVVRVYNLPLLPPTELLPQIKKLMESRGTVVYMKRLKDCVVVRFSKNEEARAAKKLNGFLLGGRHLTIAHIDDRHVTSENKVSVSNVPNDMTDEDIWSVFGPCGKIVSIHMNRDWRTKKVQRCYITFETKSASTAAISLQKELRNKQLTVKKAGDDSKMFPIENIVFITNVPVDAVENDVRQFVKSAGPISGVQFVESMKRLALVYMTKEADVDKALALSGTTFKGKTVTVSRHKKSVKYVESGAPSKSPTKKAVAAKEIPAKKQKLSEKLAPQADSEDDDDSEDDEDMSDDEDLLASFQGKMQKLKSVKTEEADEDDDDSEDDDSEDGEGEEQEDDDDDDDEDDDDDDDDEDDDDDDEDDE